MLGKYIFMGLSLASLYSYTSNAQFTSGNSFFISGTEVSINGLVIRPTANAELVGTEITLSNEAIAGSPTNSINRVYTLNKPINILGNVGIKYLPSELNGNTEAMLELAYFNETERYVTTGQSVQDPATHFVTKNFNLATMKDMLKITAVNGTSTLPVNLVSFAAKKMENQAYLTWSTASEVNSDYFEILRSRDGREWSPIGNVVSNGESKSLKNYNYTDVNPLSGDNLYRLKMVDRDATYAFSRIVNLKFEGETTNVYPNPVIGKLSMERKDWSKIRDVKIYNAAGQLIPVSKTSQNANPLVREYNFEGLPSGIYIIKTTNQNGEVVTDKISKQ
ncbi:T9SS type A sorting domain-containing protein [Dyadobacter sp. CY323]|uniref:T9SS type A sorting domain-containing protein n=1 Tax=Dyadobacter sp. CY323 TaxID=2907302 RepID=UPI001F1B6164|nr:T9SS type A sorting domain-containing protein [Dyadobacter sp. CY323]MCE6991759.1 T9SS type A sorting domain-containing protein [Dyadobacter sp. CY323]